MISSSRPGRGRSIGIATLTGPRIMFLGLLFQKAPLAQMEAAGMKVDGDRAAVETILKAIDPISGAFNIVEP